MSATPSTSTLTSTPTPAPGPTSSSGPVTGTNNNKVSNNNNNRQSILPSPGPGSITSTTTTTNLISNSTSSSTSNSNSNESNPENSTGSGGNAGTVTSVGKGKGPATVTASSVAGPEVIPVASAATPTPGGSSTPSHTPHTSAHPHNPTPIPGSGSGSIFPDHGGAGGGGGVGVGAGGRHPSTSSSIAVVNVVDNAPPSSSGPGNGPGNASGRGTKREAEGDQGGAAVGNKARRISGPGIGSGTGGVGAGGVNGMMTNEYPTFLAPPGPPPGSGNSALDTLLSAVAYLPRSSLIQILSSILQSSCSSDKDPTGAFSTTSGALVSHVRRLGEKDFDHQAKKDVERMCAEVEREYISSLPPPQPPFNVFNAGLSRKTCPIQIYYPVLNKTLDLAESLTPPASRPDGSSIALLPSLSYTKAVLMKTLSLLSILRGPSTSPSTNPQEPSPIYRAQPMFQNAVQLRCTMSRDQSALSFLSLEHQFDSLFALWKWAVDRRLEILNYAKGDQHPGMNDAERRLREALTEVLSQAREPLRSHFWLRLHYLPNPTAQVPQVDVWRAYCASEYFSTSGPHQRLVAAELLKACSLVLPGSLPDAIVDPPGTQKRFVVFGIEENVEWFHPQRSPELRCQWGDCTWKVPGSPNARVELFQHVTKQHVDRVANSWRDS